MNHMNRLINSNETRTPGSRWRAFSVCTAMAIAGVGFTALAITSPAAAQDRGAESQRQEAASTVTEDQVRQRLDAAVADGSITQDQADRRFRGWQERQQTTSGSPSIYEEEQGQRGITRQDYADAQAVMQKMVDAGVITKEQMGSQLARLRKVMGRSQPQFTQKDYDNAVAKMTEMVKEGKITRKQMKIRLGEMKKMMVKETTITREDYSKAEADMKKMVKEGKITEEQMMQRLGGMRMMIGKDKVQRQITRQDYADAQAAMQKMVDAGEITGEQMKQRLGEMRKMIGRSDDSGGVSDDCIQLRVKLGEALRAGEITREEAAVIWEKEGC